MSKLRSVWFIVTASIILGLLLAFIFTFGLFAGAIEPVITGSLMLAFGIGWSALAFLTTRYTDQPQTWAYGLGAYLGIIGLLLILFQPSNGFLSTSGWVWPIVLAVLAIWSIKQAKTHLKNRTRRWIIYPILTVLVLASVGGIYEKFQERANANKFAMTGKLISVGDHKLHIECVGKGSPTVILEAGLGDTSLAMKGWIAPAVQKETRVCVYDRAGRNWSEEASKPIDGKQTVADLHTLLQKAGEKGPFVLAGHSAGGAYVLNYALLYPNDVAGVVLLDSMSPYQYEKIPGWRSFYSMFTRSSAILPTFSRVGLLRVAMTGAYGDYPPTIAAQQENALSKPTLYRSELDEFSVIRKTLTQAQLLKTLGGRPLIVVSAKGDYPEWQVRQNDLASLSSNSSHVTLKNAEHTDLVVKKDTAAISSKSINSVVESVRTGNSLEME